MMDLIKDLPVLGAITVYDYRLSRHADTLDVEVTVESRNSQPRHRLPLHLMHEDEMVVPVDYLDVGIRATSPIP